MTDGRESGTGEKPLVWITRAEPGASATAAKIAALGYEPLVSPLIAIEPTHASIDLAGVEALAFTSANGVRAFAAAEADRSLCVYAVGEATAEAARAAGFAQVASADGDVEALAALIAAKAPGARLLHAGAAEPAGDLAGAVKAAGVDLRTVALYRAVEVDPVAALDVWERLDAVLLHSPRAARALEALMAARAAPRMRALAISKAAAESVKHLNLASVAAAPLPNERALLNLLKNTIQP